jgi:hypothetical protein
LEIEKEQERARRGQEAEPSGFGHFGEIELEDEMQWFIARRIAWPCEWARDVGYAAIKAAAFWREMRGEMAAQHDSLLGSGEDGGVERWLHRAFAARGGNGTQLGRELSFGFGQGRG